MTIINPLNLRTSLWKPIDKLVLFTGQCEIGKESVVRRAKKRGLKCVQKKIMGRIGLCITNQQGARFHVYFDYRTRRVYQVGTFPSDFASFKEYLQNLELIVEPSTLMSAVISMMDIGITLTEDFKDVALGLDVEGKQKLWLFQTGRSRTGIEFGSGDHKVLVYDKSRQLKLRKQRLSDQPLTRVEAKCEGNFKPVTNIYDLAKVGYAGDFARLCDPLRKVKVWQVTLIPEDEVHPRKRDSYFILKGCLMCAAYSEVRRILNSQRQFTKVYRPLLKIKPWIDVFQATVDALAAFFDSWRRSLPAILAPDAFQSSMSLPGGMSHART